MRYERLKEFKDEEFCRLTGIKQTTFEKMVEILKSLANEIACVNIQKIV